VGSGGRLLVYPWVDGVAAMGRGLTDRQWAALGRFAADLHRTVLPADLAAMVTREWFVPWGAGPVRELAGLWQAHRDEIAATDRPELVLCHADLHLANLLVDDQDRLAVVDDRLGEATRRHALSEFRRLFAPGDVVELARRVDRDLTVSCARGRRGGRRAGGGGGSRRPPPGRPGG
jgi:hypothetical protein